MATDLSKVVGYELPARPVASTLTTACSSSYIPPAIISLESFASFLVSADNPAFVDCVEKPPHDERHHHPHHAASPAKDEDGASGGGHDMTHLLSGTAYPRRTTPGAVASSNPTSLIPHGNTLTPKLSLRKVCEVIDQYAFVALPYPLTISAEIHCSPAQQDIVGDIMLSVFGDKLVRAPVGGRPPIGVLPSPHELRGTILLKAKNLYVSREGGRGGGKWNGGRGGWVVDGGGEEAKQERPLLQKASAAIQRVRSRPREPSVSASTTTSEFPPSSYIPLAPRPADSTKTPKTSAALLALLVHTVGVKYRVINKKEVYALQHMFSLSENTANKLLQSRAVLDVDGWTEGFRREPPGAARSLRRGMTAPYGLKFSRCLLSPTNEGLELYPAQSALSHLLFTEQQFQVLSDIQMILSIPHATQELLSAEKTPTLPMALPAFELVLKSWPNLQQTLPELAHYIGVGIAKIQEYVNKGRQSRIYVLAMTDALKAEQWMLEMTMFVTSRRHENAKKARAPENSPQSSIHPLSSASRTVAAQASGFSRLSSLSSLTRKIVSLPRARSHGLGTNPAVTHAIPESFPLTPSRFPPPEPSAALTPAEQEDLERAALEDDRRVAEREFSLY
ncbi:PLC-like phosphodiesterase [Mycena rosella]|uniref:phosphoinositide phospholipase C n=1 Tax=Mycena rosella TaxID=1033263 RepID=A0AAD7GP64_MYCRO|nr:PLC-like phosphodiesterase [Mycena rosella]